MRRRYNIRPTSYDISGLRRQAQSAPLAIEKFTRSDSEQTRVRQLENQVAALAASTDAGRASETPRTVEMSFQVGQIRDFYMHNFGRPARWRVVDWKPTGGGGTPAYFSAIPHQNEANLLRIQCGTNAGIVKIEVS